MTHFYAYGTNEYRKKIKSREPRTDDCDIRQHLEKNSTIMKSTPIDYDRKPISASRFLRKKETRIGNRLSGEIDTQSRKDFRSVNITFLMRLTQGSFSNSVSSTDTINSNSIASLSSFSEHFTVICPEAVYFVGTFQEA